MSTIARLVIELGVDDDGVHKDLSKAPAAVEQAGTDAGRRYAKGFSGALTVLKVAAATAIAGAIAIGGREISASIAEAREANKVGAITAQVIKTTGGAAGVSVAHIDRLSSRLSVLQGVDDDLVASNANLLLTFTKVRNEAGKGNQVFDRATRIVGDMSVA
ncbi:MAG: hypothetical protein L0Y54_00620, partial [Sporichthyaceae bacterium]|nr:hypothetical protein [Sporichthyaceae bacterium]